MLTKIKAPSSLLLAEREVPLKIRKIRGARRISLQWRPVTRDVLLTLPYYASLKEALAFAETRKRWLEQRIFEHGNAKPFADGAIIPVFGAPRTIRYAPESRGVVHEDGEELIVCGAAEFCARRLKDWLIGQAKTRIETLAQENAAKLGRRIKKIGVRDTVSRWGSCSPDGALSFSWRLIFAPAEVLEYVVCHEVAHLAELNHSRRFWKIVADLCPHHHAARTWLKRNGHGLYAYG